MAKKAATTQVTLSTRFDEAELAMLRKAAEMRKWSLSQLIHSGAYARAVNIVNTGHDAKYSVRRLLGDVLTQLFKPTVMASGTGQQPEVEFEFDARQFGLDIDVYASTLTPGVFGDFLDVILRLGPELVPMLIEEWRRIQFDPQKTGDLIDPYARPVQMSSNDAVDAPRTGTAEQKARPIKKTRTPRKGRKEV